MARRNIDKPNNLKKKNLIFTIATILVAIILGYGIHNIKNNYFQQKEVVDTQSHLIENNSDNNKNSETLEHNKNTNNMEDTNDEQTDIEKQKQSVNTDPSEQKNENTNENSNPNSDLTQSNLNETKEEEKKETVEKEVTKVKGIYVTGPIAGTTKQMNKLIDLVDTTELNTMVIDIKNDSGEITYKMDQELVKEIGAGVGYISDIEGLVKKLKEKNIYLIARIVAFKDPILAERKPEYAIKNKDGSLFRDNSGLCWVNPYKREVWDYLLDVAKHAVNLGFDEIQFDYIRFSTDKGIKNVDFGAEAKTKSKTEIITEFTKYSYEVLKPLGVFVSADVFGAIIQSEIDANNVGQSYVDMSQHLDYISPMIYPSHYSDGSYGIKHPDLEPYQLILASLNDSKEVLSVMNGEKAAVRPWLQDFTASWLKNYKKYDAKAIRDQINAVYDAGYEEWILWNGSNRYTESGLLGSE